MDDTLKKYERLWSDLREAIDSFGMSSKQANDVRKKMDRAWSEMSGDNQKRFYKEWSD